jgi:hypothetical protein
MTIFPGKVVNGRVEVELHDPADLPDGAEVKVFLPADDGEVELSTEELDELDAAMDEADRGECVPWEDVRRELIELERELKR